MLTAGVLALAAGAAVAAAQREDPLISLTKRLASLSAKLRTTRSRDERAELREEIEWTKHRLGPTDAAGRRIACEALWHDAALRDLEAALRRAGGAAAIRKAAEGGRFRPALQQMAAVGLTRGWADPDGVDRYRFDIAGVRIATHLEELDGLLGRAAGHLTSANRSVLPAAPPPTPPSDAGDEAAPTSGAAGAGAGTGASPAEEARGPAPDGFWSRKAADAAGREAAPEPPPPEAPAPDSTDADARTQALEVIQDGLARLVDAATRAASADRTTKAGRDAQLAALVAFLDALTDVHRATAALDAAGPTGPVVLPPEATPGLTEAHRAALAEAKAVLAAIADPSWQGIRDDLSALLGTAEAGLKVPRARREASRLLQVVTRTAVYIHDLLESRVALPETVTDRQEAIEEAMEYLEKRTYREAGYRRLLRIAAGDTLRRSLDASGLEAEAARGLLRLLHTPRDAFPVKDGSQHRARFLENVETTIRAVGRAETGPPEGIDPRCASLHAQTSAALRGAAADLGAEPPADPALLRQRAADTAAYATDLGRLERAGRVIRGAHRLMGERAERLAESIRRRVDTFVLTAAADSRDERRDFDLYLSSLESLANLRMPEKAHTAAALRLSGGAYRSAAGRFGEKLTRNFASAAQGNTEHLALTLGAVPMFTVLRHRAIAETTGLGDMDPADLDPFAFPPKPWQAYVSAMDRRLAALLKSYGTIRGWDRGVATALWEWDGVYATVLAAAHLSRTGADAGGASARLDRLVRRLGRAAEPRVDREVWIGWATGYRTLEAAVCLMSAYPATAEEHLQSLSYLRRRQEVPKRLTWRVFDPPETE